MEEPRDQSVSLAARRRYTLENSSRNIHEAVEAVLDAAALGPGMTVVDITAGTALASVGVRRRIGARGRILALDRDSEWLAVAQDLEAAAHIEYVVTELGDWGNAVPGPVDRVVSAQALWWFNQADRVLANVAARLRPGGRFACAIPGTYFDFGDGIRTPQWVFAAILAEFGQALPPSPPTLNKAVVEAKLAGFGMRVLRYRVREVATYITEWEPEGELYRFMQILPPTWPGHELSERIERALAQLRRWGPQLEGRRALWRHAVFSCVPARPKLRR